MLQKTKDLKNNGMLSQLNLALIEASKLAALAGGKCYRCGKITDIFCDVCNSWVCNEHMAEGDEGTECFCLDCNLNRS